MSGSHRVAQLAAIFCVVALGGPLAFAQDKGGPKSKPEEKAAEPEEAAPGGESPAVPEGKADAPEGEVSTPLPGSDPASTDEPEGAMAEVPEPEGMAEARAAIEAAQYAEALQSLESALQKGQAQPQHLEEVYRLQGETLVAIGNTELAIEAFKSLLLLNPEASLGEFASPKIVAVLEEARTALDGAALKGMHQVAPGSRRLEVSVSSAAVALAKKVRLTYPREDGSVAKLSIGLDEGKAIFDLPAQAKEGVELALLDGFGNVLLLWAVSDLPAPLVLGPGPVKQDTSQPIWSHWWVWAGASGVAATTGLVLGLAARSAQNDLDDVVKNPGDHFFGEAQRLEDRGKSRALWSNISFVAAAALGVTSGVMYWRGRQAEASLQLIPASEGTGASMIMSGRF